MRTLDGTVRGRVPGAYQVIGRFGALVPVGGTRCTDTPARPIEIALLAAQLDASMEICWEQLVGLDDEYLWEPGPGAWNLRPHGRTRSWLVRRLGAASPWCVSARPPVA